MASLLSRRQKHFVLAYFVEKQAGTKLPIFDRKPWTKVLANEIKGTTFWDTLYASISYSYLIVHKSRFNK